MEKILLPVDGSESCNKAINRTISLLEFIEAEVTILTVVEESPSLAGAPSKNRVNERLKNQEKLEEEAYNITGLCAEKLENKAKKVNRKVEEGNPAYIICQEANSGDYSLVVVADMGKSAIKKFFLGSTTEKVVRFCSKTVMVVK